MGKILIASGVFAVILIMITVGAYLLQFHGDLSQKQAVWSNFGSYIGGVLSPIFSFLSIIVVIYTVDKQIKKNKKTSDRELKEIRKQEQVKQYEALVHDREKFLMNLATNVVPPSDDFVALLCKSLIRDGDDWCTSKINHSEKLIYIEFFRNRDDARPLLPKQFCFEGPILYLKTVIKIVGIKKAAQIYNDKKDNFYGIKHLLSSYAATHAHLVSLLQRMLENGYDLHLAKTILSTSHEHSDILFRIGAIDPTIFELSRLISGIVPPRKSFKISPPEIMIKGLIEMGHISGDINNDDVNFNMLRNPETLDFIFTISFETIPGKKFVLEAGDWTIVPT